MKKTILLLIALAITLSLGAQHRPHQHPREAPHPDLLEMVDDLTSSQRKQLLKAQREGHAKISALHAQLDQVRDSIRIFTQKDGDNSKILYPLFDREGNLQAQVSKEMYNLRLQIDIILTPRQLEQLRKALHKSKHKR